MARWLLTGALLAMLLLIGIYDGYVLALLTTIWLKALAAIGLRQQAEALQHGVDGGVTKRLLPAAVTYVALYIGTCLLLLRLLLPAPAHQRFVLRFYVGTFALFVVLVLLGKTVGPAAWAYPFSRRVLEFIISPLPVAGLYVLLRTGFGSQNQP